jgi:hypothetical protein
MRLEGVRLVVHPMLANREEPLNETVIYFKFSVVSFPPVEYKSSAVLPACTRTGRTGRVCLQVVGHLAGKGAGCGRTSGYGPPLGDLPGCCILSGRAGYLKGGSALPPGKAYYFSGEIWHEI